MDPPKGKRIGKKGGILMVSPPGRQPAKKKRRSAASFSGGGQSLGNGSAASSSGGGRASMQTVIPPSFVYREADDKLLMSLMESQRRRWATGKGPELLLVLDDVAWDTAFFNSKAFKQLAFNGRHMHITVILCMQYALCIPPQRWTPGRHHFALGQQLASRHWCGPIDSRTAGRSRNADEFTCP